MDEVDHSTFRSLHNRNFRLFFTGQLVSQTGSWLSMVVQTLLVLKLAGSGVSLGNDVKVGDGAHLNRVAVLDGAEIEGGRLYEDVILGPRGVRVALT